MEDSSAVTMNGFQWQEIIPMNVTNVMLRKRSQTPKRTPILYDSMTIKSKNRQNSSVHREVEGSD